MSWEISNFWRFFILFFFVHWNCWDIKQCFFGFLNKLVFWLPIKYFWCNLVLFPRIFGCFSFWTLSRHRFWYSNHVCRDVVKVFLCFKNFSNRLSHSWSQEIKLVSVFSFLSPIPNELTSEYWVLKNYLKGEIVHQTLGTNRSQGVSCTPCRQKCKISSKFVLSPVPLKLFPLADKDLFKSFVHSNSQIIFFFLPSTNLVSIKLSRHPTSIKALILTIFLVYPNRN
jgi:hypothetical protein